MRACNMKADRIGDGVWACASDHQCHDPSARWTASFSICDHSGSQYVSVFDEIGQKVLGCTAQEMAQLWDRKDDDVQAAMEIERVFKAAQFKRWRLRLRSKKEVWNDEERVKVVAVDCDPLRLSTDGRVKLEQIFASLSE